MAINRIVTTEYRNQLVNGDDFTANPTEFATNLVGNCMSAVQCKAQITVSWSASAQTFEPWDLTANQLTRSSGNFYEDGFFAGQEFAFIKAGNTSFTASIDSIDQTGRAITFTALTGTVTPANDLATVEIRALGNAVANQFGALFYRFGLPTNNQEFTIDSRISNTQQRYQLSNLTGVLQPMTAQGTVMDFVTGSAEARLVSTDTYTQTYEVVHEFVIAPWALEDQANAIRSLQPPSYFAGNECLRHCFEIQLSKSFSQTQGSIITRVDDIDGSTGWFNESLNGGANGYQLGSIAYQDSASMNPVDSLQIGRETMVTFTVSGAFTAGQRVGVLISAIPESSNYIGTPTNALENFLYESIYLTEGTQYTGLGIFKSIDASLQGGNLTIMATIDYDANDFAIIEGRSYVLALDVGDVSLGVQGTNAVTILMDVGDYITPDLEGLFEVTQLDFAFADEAINGDSLTTDYLGFPTDSLAIKFAYELDTTRSAQITAMEFNLIADKESSNKSFLLDSYKFDFSQAVFSNGIQSIQIDTTRGYPFAEGNQYNIVKIDNAPIVAGIKTFTGQIGQKLRWEDWLKNINAEQEFYDDTKPNNNLNFLSSNYSGILGYEVRAEIKAIVSGLDDSNTQRQTVYSFKSPALATNGYGSNFGYDVVTTLKDAETNEDLGNNQFIAGRDAIISATITPQSGFFLSLANAWAAIRLCEIGNTGQRLFEVSTTYATPTGSILQPLEGNSTLNIVDQGGSFLVEALVKGNQLTANNYFFAVRYDQRINAILIFRTTDDSFIQVVKSGTPAIIITTDNITRVFLPDNDPENITAFYADDLADPNNNAGISTDLELDDRFTGLREIRARNQDFGFVSGTWVRNANVDIDVSNSLITATRVESIIDSIIISNGGTITDDGSNYTGLPGETHANRLLALGTIELDLTDPENNILFQKIVALESVGWTITTVLTLCLKSLNVNTSGLDYVASQFEKTRNLEGLDYISGDPLTILLYNSEAEAKAGGATGLLAAGFTNVNNWLLDDNNYNAWIAGNPKGIRFEASSFSFSRSVLRYKAFPTTERLCGENDLYDYFTGKAKVYDESGYDEFDLSTITSNNQSFSVLVSLDQLLNNNFSELFLLRDTANRTRYYASFISNQLRFFVNADSDNSVPADGIKRATTTQTPQINLNGQRGRFILTYDGVTKEIKITLNGVNDTQIVADTTPQGVFTPDYIRIGDAERIDQGFGTRLSARIRRFEIINFAASDAQILKAANDGSFREAADVSEFLLDLNYQQNNGTPPTTSADTPFYTNTPLGNNNYQDF